jgi:hypothetical protein
LRDLLTYDSSNLFTPASVWPILRQSSNLLHCELHLSFYHDQPTPDITLSRLETLILDSYMLRATGFLHTLVVPALRTLDVAEDLLGASPIETLASFISKSGCSLREVRVTRHYGLIQDDLYREAFPSIPTFSFEKL